MTTPSNDSAVVRPIGTIEAFQDTSLYVEPELSGVGIASWFSSMMNTLQSLYSSTATDSDTMTYNTTSLWVTLNALRLTAENGQRTNYTSDPSDPLVLSYFSLGQLKQINLILGDLQACGFDPMVVKSGVMPIPGSDAFKAMEDAYTRWRELPDVQSTLTNAIAVGSSNVPIMDLVAAGYLATGEDQLYSQLNALNTRLDLTQGALEILTDIQNQHNLVAPPASPTTYDAAVDAANNMLTPIGVNPLLSPNGLSLEFTAVLNEAKSMLDHYKISADIKSLTGDDGDPELWKESDLHASTGPAFLQESALKDIIGYDSVDHIDSNHIDNTNDNHSASLADVYYNALYASRNGSDSQKRTALAAWKSFCESAMSDLGGTGVVGGEVGDGDYPNGRVYPDLYSELQAHDSEVRQILNMPTTGGLSLTDAAKVEDLLQTDAASLITYRNELAQIRLAGSDSDIYDPATDPITYDFSNAFDPTTYPDYGTVGQNTLEWSINQVLKDLEFLQQPDTSIYSNLSAWLIDNMGVTTSSTGSIQNNLTAALTAGENLNSDEQQQMNQIEYIFQQFYDSAAAVMSTLNQVLQNIAQNIAR